MGDNGVWIGPFQTRDIARQSLREHFNINNIEDCEHFGKIKFIKITLTNYEFFSICEIRF